jgi:hypothetical protein
MSADAVCGAAYGERSGERVNTRNGYRQRPWDTPGRQHRPGDPEAASGQLLPPAGCWNGAAGRRRRWSASSPRPICWASRSGGWRSWSRPWASPGYRNRRSVRWPETSMPRWRRSGVQVGALLVHSGALSRRESAPDPRVLPACPRSAGALRFSLVACTRAITPSPSWTLTRRSCWPGRT